VRVFRYQFDPLCLLACAGYTINRWLLPSAWKGPFLQGHFNDLLLIPAALPLVLRFQRATGLRTHDHPPAWSEILLHLIVWSLAAEVIAPWLFSRATADLADVAAYAAGAVGAGLLWQRA